MLIFARIKHNILKGLSMWIYLTYVGLKTFLILIVAGSAANVLRYFIRLIDEACNIKDERPDKAIAYSLLFTIAVIGISILCIHLYNDMLLIEVTSNIHGLSMEEAKEIINLYQGESNE